jgi:hypothetical protein
MFHKFWYGYRLSSFSCQALLSELTFLIVLCFISSGMVIAYLRFRAIRLAASCCRFFIISFWVLLMTDRASFLIAACID